MTTVENHQDILSELLEDIDEKIRADLILQRQKILGFALSEASAHLLAILLLKKRLVSSGFTVNHRFFSSKERAKERFGFDFPHKEELLNGMVAQEHFRDRLCYGKHKQRKEVEDAIKNLFSLKKCIDSALGEEL